MSGWWSYSVSLNAHLRKGSEKSDIAIASLLASIATHARKSSQKENHGKIRVRCGIRRRGGRRRIGRMRGGGAADGKPEDFALRDRGRRARPQSLDPYSRGFGKLVPNPKINWGYETEPEPGLGGRSIIWPRGKVVGGSGSINGLVFLRGAPSDYDEWQRLGARGWGYKDVLPYFKRMEHCVDGADEWRGTGGPITVSNIKRPSTVAKAFVEACERLQYPAQPGFQRRAHRRRRLCAAQRPQWLAPLDRGRLSPAEPFPEKSGIDDQDPCPQNPVRGTPRRRRRGRARRTNPAHRRAARTDPVRRRHQFAGAAAGLRHRPGRRAGAARHRRETGSARRRQEPAGSLPGEFCVQDQQRRHPQ